MLASNKLSFIIPVSLVLFSVYHTIYKIEFLTALKKSILMSSANEVFFYETDFTHPGDYSPMLILRQPRCPWVFGESTNVDYFSVSEKITFYEKNDVNRYRVYMDGWKEQGYPQTQMFPQTKDFSEAGKVLNFMMLEVNGQKYFHMKFNRGVFTLGFLGNCVMDDVTYFEVTLPNGMVVCMGEIPTFDILMDYTFFESDDALHGALRDMRALCNVIMQTIICP